MDNVINSRFYSNQREVLGEVAPLDTPFRLAISISEICNFRCIYCFRSVKGADTLSSGYSDRPFMDMRLFEKTVNDAKMFPKTIKKIFLNITGEPLTHKELPQMIKYVKSVHPQSTICIQTNGSLLTRELAEQIAESGLDDMLISLQGISAEKYREICGADIDFRAFVDNIGYLNSIKGSLNLYAKIANIALSEGEENEFYDIFSPITDQATIEYITSVFNEVDYTRLDGIAPASANRLGKDYGPQEVCSIPFYGLSITTNGNVYPCVQSIVPLTYGNVRSENLADIWNGETRANFLRTMLEKKSIPRCDNCTSKSACVLSPEDMITPYADSILARLDKQTREIENCG
jgi:radical SAM protein with 4Fe4S-binding SPASM domain